MIGNLSDDNVTFLIEIIQRLMPQAEEKKDERKNSDGAAAFQRLMAASEEIGQYLPDDFDPEKELEEARAECNNCLS